MTKFFFFLALVSADVHALVNALDMGQLCSTDDIVLKDPGRFPRWNPPPGSAIFVSFSNLTTYSEEPSKECNRISTTENDFLLNEGEDCDFTVMDENGDWTTHLKGKIEGTIQRYGSFEITNFSSDSMPPFEWRDPDRKVVFDNRITRLCRRNVNGKLTDEIILEMKDQFDFYNYLILDVYPSNI